jgi:hypothetical protein
MEFFYVSLLMSLEIVPDQLLALLEFELLPWLVDIFSMINLSSTEIRRLTRDAYHFCRQVHGKKLHGNKIHGI